MWQRKRKAERLPWYRAGDPKGHVIIDSIPEAVKRELDAFRAQPKHPAAQEDDLPEEVRDYIGQMEIDLYDKNQEAAASEAVLVTVIAVLALFFTYRGCVPGPAVLSYAGAVLLAVWAWLKYRREWNKNAEDFMPEGYNPTDEAIRREWEIKYLVRRSNGG